MGYFPIGDEFQVNSYTENSQSHPSVAGLPNGGFIAVWVSEHQDGSFGGIYAQLFGSDGATVGDEFQVNTEATYDQTFPAVTALTDGRFVITWQSISPGGGVFGQIYGNDGSAIGNEFQIFSYDQSAQKPPSIASLSDGGFVVVCPLDEIIGQRYDSSGNEVGSAFQINTNTYDTQYASVVAETNDGGFVVVWSSDRQDGSAWGIFAQRFDSSGAVVGGEFQVNSHWDDMQTEPSVAGLRDGGFIVTWSSRSQDGDGWGIYGQRYDSDGTALGEEFRVNSTTHEDQNDPDVTALADGGFVVTWNSRHEFASEDVYAQVYDVNGIAVAGEFRVNTSVDDNRYYQTTASLEDGGFVVSWTSFLQDGSWGGIFGQRFAENNAPFGNVFHAEKATQGTHLIADTETISDSDGLGAFSYQWLRDGSAIRGATSASYTPTASDVGFSISVSVSYTDGAGVEHTLVSAATEDVVGDLVLIGDAYSNVITGGLFNDRLVGRAGDDTLSGNKGDDILLGGLGADTAAGGAGTDTLKGNGGSDRLVGNGGNDLVLGGGGRDSLLGGGGNDTLSGGSGHDILQGQRGHDEVTGGGGRDTFVFNRGDGADTITDFELGIDHIQIGRGASRFGQLDFEQVGDDVLVSFRNVEITVENTAVDDLAVSDHFQFV